MSLNIIDEVFNEPLTYKYFDNNENQNNLVLIFSLKSCQPCNSLLNILKDVYSSMSNNTLPIIYKYDATKLCPEDSDKIMTYPFIISINTEQQKKWKLNNSDLIFDHINDLEYCTIYTKKIQNFLNDYNLNSF